VWLWTILFRGEGKRAYNTGSPIDLTIKQVAETVANALNALVEIQVGQPVKASKNPSRYVPNTDLAEMGLGLTASIGLTDAIQRTEAWLRRSLKS
jgi:nucleoside-diphosphate-sugar epimerase